MLMKGRSLLVCVTFDSQYCAEVSVAELSLEDIRSYHKNSGSIDKIASSLNTEKARKIVAVKSLKAEVLMSEDNVLDFIKEIKVLHNLMHR